MVLFSACLSGCLSCTVKTDGTRECKTGQCAPKFASKDADKTCVG